LCDAMAIRLVASLRAFGTRVTAGMLHRRMLGVSVV
jgi:hypothetical protein